MKCLKCNCEHDGLFGSGKYCSRGCANSRNHSEEICKKIGNKLKGRKVERKKKLLPGHICSKCGTSFLKHIRDGRKIVCNNCMRKVVNHKTGNFSLVDLSPRTISKIFKRANLGCAICGWNESICDLHHIIERSNGGSDELSNLIYVCPNHHRIIHNEQEFDKTVFINRTLDKILPNWKDFYHPNLKK